MINNNTQFKFEAKIPSSSKVVAFTRNHKESHKIFKFKGQFDLEGQGHQFSNPSIRCLINSLCWKVKFQKVQFLTAKINILEVRRPI